MQITEIVKRLRKRQTINHIHKKTGTHRKTIRKIKKLAEEKGWLHLEAPMPNPQEISSNYKATNCPPAHRLDPYKEEIEEWRKKGYTFTVIYLMLKERVKTSETAVREYCRSRFPEIPDPVMRREQTLGLMDTDFGYLGKVVDEDGNERKAWIFSARLRFSRRAFRYFVLAQRQEKFFEGHVHAFEYFGGVPHTVCLDNLKAGVIKPTDDNECFNSTYLDLAEYYGFMISPCLPRTPEHKGGVENDIGYIKKNFWPLFVENQKQKGRTIPLAKDLQEYLDKWNREVADVRKVGQVGYSPQELFNIEEYQHLLPLPEERWDPIVWKEAKVGRDWRVRFDNAFYAVPYEHIGEKVMICSNTSQVRIFLNYNEIANYPRATEKWQYLRKDVFAPLEKEEVLSTTKVGLLTWAEKIGPLTNELLGRMLENKQIDKLRPARLLLQLTSIYSEERLESACKRALYYETIGYVSVKNILIKELDREPLEEETTSQPEKKFRFSRKSADYQT